MIWFKTIALGVGLGLLMGALLTGLDAMFTGSADWEPIRFLTAITGGVVGAVAGRASCHAKIKELRRELAERFNRQDS